MLQPRLRRHYGNKVADLLQGIPVFKFLCIAQLVTSSIILSFKLWLFLNFFKM